MVTKKRVFDHDSLQDMSSVIEYLATLTDGFRTGQLSVTGPEGEIVLRPQGLVRMELRASQRDDRDRLTLRLTWKPTLKDDEPSRSRLQIRAETD